MSAAATGQNTARVFLILAAFPAIRRKGMRSKQANSVKRKTSGKPQAATRQKPAAACRTAGSGTRALLTLRSAFILTAALAVSATAGVLSYLASASLPAAFLAAGPACAAVITLLNAVIE